MRGIASIHHLGIKAFFLRWLLQAQVKKLYQFMRIKEKEPSIGLHDDSDMER